MGVTGLWRLIEPAGKPVPVETLENKVLAVDISIWLHQMVKGYQDAKGAPLPNAHLMGLFQRLCKLLYFRIKPVFVFDGGFPELKKETIAKRQDNKAKYNSESERIKRELALLLSKKTAVNSLLGKQISPKKGNVVPNSHDDMFKLPALPEREESESESEDEQNSSGSTVDLHSVDIESENFKKLDVKEKYDLLVELKETRKMNSWGRLHELPKKSDTFSDFQMQRLLKRRKVQECLEETEKEMGDSGMSLNDLESLLNEEGIDTKIETLPTRRIASNVTTRYLLIKDMKQALADAKQRDETKNEPTTSKEENQTDTERKPDKVDELEDDLQKAIKMSLECVDEPNTSIVSKTDDSWTSCLTDTDYSDDSEEYDGFEAPDMSSAKAYIKQYSDFTYRVIDQIVIDRHKTKTKSKSPRVEKILEEINNEKSVIVDNVDISSEDDNSIQDIPSSSSEEIDTVKSKASDDREENCTQASVICVEVAKDVIELDTSTEENEVTGRIDIKADIKEENHISDNEITEEVTSQQITDSSDSDFEEVPEEEIKSNKPVVELTLNVGDAPDDDIFADIFVDSKNTIDNQIDKNQYNETETTSNISTHQICNLGVNKGINEDGSNKTQKKSVNPETLVQSDTKLISDVQVTNVDNLDINSSEKNKTSNIEVDASNSKIVPNIPDKMNIQDTMANKTAEDIIDSDKQQPSTSNVTDVSCFTTQNKESNGRESIANDNPKAVLSTEQLNSMVEELQNEEQNLQQEKGRLDRVGRNITEQMTKEAQELLQIFGIPYIVAPMEAEAQCAFLENVKLTDGTITDDSDIWLFGGKTVYKNFFNQKKHVMQFLFERIEASFNLSREQLVLLALLVGSDYTTGVNGVGPVTALEILASFPFNKRNFLSETSKPAQYSQIVQGLQEFKQWVRSGKRTDNTSLKKKLKNVSLNDDFPSVRVVQAYLEPNIEKSEEKFTWGEIDLTVLRDYTKTKFGWSQNKLDEIIKPVLKRILERKSQRSMQDYFKRKIEFQSLDEHLSKRVKAAVQKMTPGADPNEPEKNPIKNKPTKRKLSKASGSTSEAGPLASKIKKTKEDSVLKNLGVKVVSQEKDGKSQFEITIPKTDRYQELIPQREKDQKNLLENKLKAIELFRKTNIDKKKKVFKRKALVPKEKADLSESDSD